MSLCRRSTRLQAAHRDRGGREREEIDTSGGGNRRDLDGGERYRWRHGGGGRRGGATWQGPAPGGMRELDGTRSGSGERDGEGGKDGSAIGRRSTRKRVDVGGMGPERRSSTGIGYGRSHRDEETRRFLPSRPVLKGKTSSPKGTTFRWKSVWKGPMDPRGDGWTMREEESRSLPVRHGSAFQTTQMELKKGPLHMASAMCSNRSGKPRTTP